MRPYLIISQLAIEVVEDLMVETMLEALMKIGAKVGQSRPALTVDRVHDQSIESHEYRSAALLSSRQLHDHESALQHQDAAAKEKERIVKENSKQSRMQSYAKVVRAQYLLDPLHQIFAGVAVRAKKDVQQSMMQLPVWIEPVNSQADVGLMVGSSPHVCRERNRMMRIGTEQDEKSGWKKMQMQEHG